MELTVSPNIPPPELRASGGSTYFFNNKPIHVFTSPGTFASLPNWNDVDVEYVVVGGGGGGGNDNWGGPVGRGAGGGGAGGYRTGTTPYTGHFSVPVVIGAGGAGLYLHLILQFKVVMVMHQHLDQDLSPQKVVEVVVDTEEVVVLHIKILVEAHQILMEVLVVVALMVDLLEVREELMVMMAVAVLPATITAVEAAVVPVALDKQAQQHRVDMVV